VGNEPQNIARKGSMARDLLKNTILVLLTEAPGLGEIQLRKAMVIVDVLNTSYYGKGLTGAEYIKYPHGPVPDSESWKVIAGMVRDDLIYIKEEPVGRFTKHGYYRKQDPDYSYFSQDQIAYIQSAAEFAVKNTARNLSDLTHDEVYQNTPMGQVIPLTSMLRITVKPSKRLNESQKEEVRAAINGDEANILALVGEA
jgi:hypothetical protein